MRVAGAAGTDRWLVRASPRQEPNNHYGPHNCGDQPTSSVLRARILRHGALFSVFCSELQAIESQAWDRLKSAGKHAKDGSAVSDGMGDLSYLPGDRTEFPRARFVRLKAVETPDNLTVGDRVVGNRR